jgi:HAD superfamily hydrolase (TIGR01490 family)
VGETRNIAAFFDLDGTLFQGHFWSGVVKHHFKHRVKILQVSIYIVTHIIIWLASKFKMLSEETYKVKWGEDLAIAFKGFNREEGAAIFRQVSNDYVLKSLRPDIMTLLQRHRDQGHIIVLVSGGYSDFLETIKQELGADYIVGTQLEVKNNRYSGRIIKPFCFGINKARLLEEFISREKLNIDLSLSFAYADSIVDVPVLEMVGNPVATYPDKELSNLARRRGWKILP